MQTIEELLEERKHKIRTLEDLKEKRAKEGDRSYTADEKETISTIQTEIVQLQKDIDARAEDDKITKAIDDHVASLSVPQDIHVPRGGERKLTGSTRDLYPRNLRRAGKLKAFPDTQEGHEAAYRSGKWIQAQLLGDADARRWCDRHDIATEKRIMIEGAIAKGGALVPDELDQQIILLREQYGTIRQNSRLVPMASDTKNVPRQTAGFTPYFVGEKTALTASDTTWDVVSLVANKLTILNRMSSELNEDAIISMADQFAMDAAHAFALKEDQCGINGDATLTYGGITGIRTKLLDFDGGGTNSAGTFTVAAINTWATCTMAAMEGTLAVCPAYALSGDPAWYCSQVCYALVFQRLLLAQGGSTAAEAAAGLTPRFMGYPIRISQVMPTTTGTQTNEIMFLFGDMSLACLFGDRRGIQVESDTSRYFETDEIALRAIERFDFVHANPGDATTAGPLVGYYGSA